MEKTSIWTLSICTKVVGDFWFPQPFLKILFYFIICPLKISGQLL